MKSSKLGGVGLAAMAAVAMSGSLVQGASVVDPAFKTQQAQQGGKTTPNGGALFNKAMAGIFGGMGVSYTRRKKPGPGWSNRQVKRMATKRRNVIRNRKAHR